MALQLRNTGGSGFIKKSRESDNNKDSNNNNNVTESLNNHSDKKMFTGLDRVFSHYVGKCLNYSFLMGSGGLLHKVGTMYRVFCPMLALIH